MGTQYKNVGGSGTGLGQDFSKFLQSGLNTGSFGAGTAVGQYGMANPMGQTQGIGGFLNSLLSPGAGVIGGALAQQLQTQQTNDINSIRSRFGAAGGTAFGTPGQYAESVYRAQAAPAITSAIGGLQLQGLNSILPYIGQMAGKDIPQAEVAAQENPWMTAAKLGIGLGSTALGFGINPFGSLGGAAAGGLAGNVPGMAGYGGPMPTFSVPGGSFSGVPMNLPLGTMTMTGSPLNSPYGGYTNPMLSGYAPSFSLRY